MPGEYTFGTKEAEHMEIISGKSRSINCLW